MRQDRIKKVSGLPPASDSRNMWHINFSHPSPAGKTLWPQHVQHIVTLYKSVAVCQLDEGCSAGEWAGAGRQGR